MKKIVFIIIISLFAFRTFAQTEIKWNAAYWLAGIANMSVETSLNNKFTYNLDLVFSPWKSVNGKPYLVGQAINEFRFYPSGVFEKFYVGAYAAYHNFKMTRFGYNKDKYQIGLGYSFGATVGYKHRISDRWSMDIYCGAGWLHSKYRGYDRRPGDMYIGWNGSGEWLPYKAGIAFSYRIGKK